MKLTARLDFAFWGRRRLPVVIQDEYSECGPACVAMIAAYWGHQIDAAHMRLRFPTSVKGVTLTGLIRLARTLNLQARPVKLELSALAKLSLPCILHWEMTHFVVLKGVGAKQIVIHDPAVGVRRMNFDEVSKRFTGVALELSPTSDFKPVAEVRKLKISMLVGRVVGLRGGLFQLFSFGICLQFFALLTPFYLQWIVDDALLAGDRDLVTVLALGFLGLAVVQAGIATLRSWVAVTVSANVNFQWLGHAFGHLMRLPVQYFERRQVGDIVSRFGSIQIIQKALTTNFVEATIDGMLVVTTLIVMTFYSVQLASIALLAVALYCVLRWAIYSRLREASAEQIVHSARQQTHFLETARGIQSIKVFGRGEERRIGWLHLLTNQINSELRVARLSISYQTASSIIFGTERVFIVWLAALLVLDSKLSIGMLFAFLSYKEQFTGRISSLIDKIFELKMLSLHADRVADILSVAPEQNTEHEHPALDGFSVEYRDVSFQYGANEDPVLRNVNLFIPAGQSIVITGSSGSGKTTLVKLLLGLIQPTSGEVLVGGIPMSRLGGNAFRERVGAVLQDEYLFSGSIAENIAFFELAFDQARVQQCASLAAIHDEITRMPMGYSTVVGDNGMGLSGGQRQRVFLARALYRDPRLLVLDEATSHLDVANEQQVNAAIRSLNLTRVVVAHRAETISTAQRVVVIENGVVARDLMQPIAHAGASG